MNVTSRQRRRPMAEINVVPYIDVMLVLLVIFMITTPLLSQGVNVDLPKANAQQIASQDKEPIILSVDAQGRYFLNINADPQQPIEAEAIVNLAAKELAAAQQQGNKRPVLVKGDSRVDYGKVVAAMVLLQQAGAENVGLVTVQPEPQSR